jgi:cell wall assembly regulator SMI1
MGSQLADLVERRCDAEGIVRDLRPTRAQLEANFWTRTQTCRVGADHARLVSWERRFGFDLPGSLKAWLRLSDGFYGEKGPLIHPLSAIGPMVPFARMPGLVVQPESWFELGNPNLETVCIDLAYRWPGGGAPLFTSGDDLRQSPPKIIAPSFAEWFLRLLHRGGAEYWFEPGFAGLGDPWAEHRRRVPTPALPDRLRRLIRRAGPLVHRGLDDQAIADGLGISRNDAEVILRHWQHAPADYAESGA